MKNREMESDNQHSFDVGETAEQVSGGFSESSVSIAAGDRIGRYVIREKLGEGGFGYVYSAEQKEPIRRNVALKVLKPGMDSNAVIARFEAERQALALMDHPFVAKVLDGGVTPQGWPFFVMELVHGIPLTEHCDKHRLGIRERVLLFIKICEAIQHAHNKGVIHRDLKPGNILVEYRDDESSPKVIDFGIAKAVNQQLATETIFTQQGQLIGTPAYMSPEQAESDVQRIDTRSDIYALGVILYELLTGTRPFDDQTLQSAGPIGFQKIIREVEPPRPSTRISRVASTTTEEIDSAEIATARQIEIGTLGGVLRRDLDWVVMKCLEKDRARRYETANGLAEDLRRYLSDQPVLASPPNASYRIGKFVKRNRVGVAVVAAGLVLMLAGLAGTSYGLLEARHQKYLAEEAFQNQLIQRRLADERAEEATQARQEAELAQQSEAKRVAELELMVDFQASQLDIDHADFGQAIRRRLIEAVETNADHEASEERAQDLANLTQATDFTGVGTAVLNEFVFQPSITRIRQQFQEQPLVRASLLHSLGFTMRNAGLFVEALPVCEEVVEIRREHLGTDHQEMIDALYRVAYLDTYLGNNDLASERVHEALAISKRLYGDEHTETRTALNNLGSLYGRSGKFADAIRYLRESYELSERIDGKNADDTLLAMGNLGSTLHRNGDLEEAEQLLTESVKRYREVLGAKHTRTLTTMNNLGTLLADLGEFDRAESLFKECIEVRRLQDGFDHPMTLAVQSNLALLYARTEQADEGLQLIDETLAAATNRLGAKAPMVGNFIGKRGRILAKLNRFEESESELQDAYILLVEIHGNEHEQSRRVAGYLVELYEAWDSQEPDSKHLDSAEKWRSRM